MAKKLYYKIGEACKILEIQPYVLRYWETEFPFLKPNKSKSGQRVYSDHELDVIRRIKELLYEEGYTIAGAKKKLESELTSADGGRDPEQTLSKKTAAAPPPPATPEPAAEKNESSEKKLEELRLGIEAAVGQAREILEALR